MRQPIHSNDTACQRRGWPSILAALVLITAALTWANAASAAPGDLDASFGTNGTVLTSVDQNGVAFGGRAVVRQSDGKLVVVGDATDAAGNDVGTVVRYNADGSLDTAFGTNGIVSLPAFGGDTLDPTAVALQADGSIVVAGTAGPTATPSGFLSQPDALALTRLSAVDGSVDTTFGTDGLVILPVGSASEDSVSSVVVDQGTGRIYVGGAYVASTVTGDTDAMIVAFTSAGAKDTGFDTSGVIETQFGTATQSFIRGLALDGSDLVASGYAATSTPTSQAVVVRYTSAGAVDPTFNSGAILTLDLGTVANESESYTDVVNSDHSILIGGWGHYMVGGTETACAAVARISQAGALDTSFGTSGIAHQCSADDAETTSLLADSSGIYAAGYNFDVSAGYPSFMLAHYGSDGSIDTSFGTGGSGFVLTSPNGAYAAQVTGAALTGSDVVMAGYATTAGSDNEFALQSLEEAAGGGTGGGGATAPTNTTAPTLTVKTDDSGTPTSLESSVGTWSGTTPITYQYAWQRCPTATVTATCTSLQSGHSRKYLIQHPADEGSYIVMAATATNSAGTSAPVTVSYFVQRVPQAPAYVSGAFVHGNGTVGGLVTFGFGSWSGDAPISYTYTLVSCWGSPSTTTGICQVRKTGDTQDQQYVAQASDYGNYLILEMRATNAVGAGTADSPALLIGTEQPVSTRAPYMNMHGDTTPYAGSTYTGEAGDWVQSADPITFSWQWLACSSTSLKSCSGVSSSQSFQPTSKLVGKHLLLEVTATNAAGATTAYSPFSTPVDTKQAVKQRTADTTTLTKSVPPTTTGSALTHGTDTVATVAKHPQDDTVNGSVNMDLSKTIALLQQNGPAASVIAAGAGNVIAAGAGNVIAAGGGNVIAAGGGNVIAAGGGNVIAAGGGNVIAAGGGNSRLAPAVDGLLPNLSFGEWQARATKTQPKKQTTKLKLRSVVLFSGSHLFKRAGKATIKLKLTAEGRKLIAAYEKYARTAKRKHHKVKALRIAVTTIVGPVKRGHGSSVYKVRFITITP